MKIGIIGSGHIGATAARLFARTGHEVAVSNSRGGGGLEGLIKELGDGARATGIEEAARFGEVLLVAIPFGKYETLPAGAFEGKVVVDANNYYPQRDGDFPVLDSGETTSSELVAWHLKGARVVKGFNTIWFEHLAKQGDTSLPVEERRAIFIAGDDEEAKQTVMRLVEEIGFAVVDTGTLAEGGRRQQVGTAVYNKELTAREAAQVLSAE